MGERKEPLRDGAEKVRREPRAFETVRVDRPPGLFFNPHAFPWGSSLPIGWSARLDHQFPHGRIPDAASDLDRRGERDH